MKISLMSNDMKRFKIKGIGFYVSFFVLCMTVLVMVSWRKHPAAVMTVVDSAGKPIKDVVVTPYALRPKTAGGAGGHYGWISDLRGVEPTPVTTDQSGQVLITYPRYVVERLETEKITIRLNHPNYVSSNPEVTVSAFPARGAPWKVWLDYYITRLKHKVIVSHPAPVILLKGGSVVLKPSSVDSSMQFYAISSSSGNFEEGFWQREPSGEVVTYKHETGSHSLRMIGRNEGGGLMFSDIINTTIEAGKTNHIQVTLKEGHTVRGKLDAHVSRPVVNGVVVVNINPPAANDGNYPLMWHSWAKVESDGTFEVSSLPPGELEIIALCSGFVSKSAPGGARPFGVPQKYDLEDEELDIVVEMEPTAYLEVTVLDENEEPIEGAQVYTSPNVRWGDRFSTIFGGDCYHTMDRLMSLDAPERDKNLAKQRGFAGVTDTSGLAVLSNVPVHTTSFGVEHTDYVLPKIKTQWGAEHRRASVSLSAGVTNRVSITLEPKGRAPLRHY